MLFLSIIIPSYNSEKTILPLLESIARSKNINLRGIEVIVVDDKSTDGTVEKVQNYLRCKAIPPARWNKIIQLKTNNGPAHARNVGVKYATGKVVVFLDSDVVLYKNTLSEIVRAFQNDPDILALTGVWDKRQRSRTFFPKFKALRDWSYWINERDPRNYYYLFSTRIAAIERGLFLRLGGFDESYKAALVEDIELTYRIARRHAIVFDPKVIVHHEFEGFVPIAKKYFWRAYYWSRMYRTRKKFDPVATTGKEAVTTVSAGLLVFLFSLSILSILSSALGRSALGGHLRGIKEALVVATGIVFFIHLWGVRKFLWFCFKEEGLLFSLKALGTGIVLYLVILSGSLFSFITFSGKKNRGFRV